MAGAALVLLVVLLYRDALAGGVFYKRDIHQIWHPQVEAVVRAVAEGAWPVWDPSPAFGQPLLADPGAQVLYPPTWLNLVMKPWWAYTAVAIGHALFSGLCLLALLRRWGLSPIAAWTGAAAWTLSGPYLSFVDLWHHFAGVSFLPAVFLCADAALASRRPRDLLRLGVVLGLQLLAGSADAWTMTLLAVGAYAVVVGVGPRGFWAGVPVVAGLAAAVVIAAVIAAGVWVPTLEAVSRSARGSLPESARTHWSVHPIALGETLLLGVPSALPLDAPSRARLFEGREPFLSSLYLGLPCLALAVGAARARDRRRAAVLGGLLLAALLVALGRHGFFYDALVTIVPPLRVMRYPVKAMAVAVFAWAGLVGLGVDAWRASASRMRGLVVLAPLAGAAAATLVAVALVVGPGERPLGLGLDPAYGPVLAPLGRSLLLHAALGVLALAFAAAGGGGGRLRTIGPPLAALVAVADLAFAHPRPNPTAPVAFYTHRPAILRAFDGTPSPRVYAYNYGEPGPSAPTGASRPDRVDRRPEGWSLDAATALGQQLVLAPQCAGRWRLGQAFDTDYRGLQATPLATFTRLAGIVDGRPEALVHLLRLASVTHVVALHDVAGGRLTPVAEDPGLFASPVRAWAVPGALPRARVVTGVRIADGRDAAGTILSPDFDAGREVLLAAGSARPAPEAPAGRASIVEERADRLSIEAEAAFGGYLVVADSYDPGWQVRVDGRPAPLLRADMAFRAVALSAGRHVVEMVYRPRWTLAAVGVTAVSLAVAFLVLWLTGRRRAPAGVGSVGSGPPGAHHE